MKFKKFLRIIEGAIFMRHKNLCVFKIQYCFYMSFCNCCNIYSSVWALVLFWEEVRYQIK